MKNIRSIKMLCVLLLPLTLSAANVYWQRDGSGNWNGDWSERAHWSTGEVPTSTDKVFFPSVNGDVTISVNATYEVGSLEMVAMTGTAGRRYDFKLTGSGRITLAGSDGNGYSSWVKERRSLTLDGVSMVDIGWQDLMVRGRIIVKTGALLKNTRIAKFMYKDAEYIVDGGRFEFSELQYNATTDWSGADWPMRLVLTSGSVSGGYIYSTSNMTAPFVVEIGGGTMNITSRFDLHNDGSELLISNGSLTVSNDRFTIASNATVTVSGGALKINTAAQIDPEATLNLTGGTLTLGRVTDDARIIGAKGITLRYDYGTGVFTRSASAPVAAESIRLARFETDSNASSVLHGKFREIVFSSSSEPFRFGNSNQRNFYLEGPTTIRAEANQQDNAGSTWYTHLTGDFTVDTIDAADGVSKRHLSLWSTASRLGTASLTVRGGGSLCLLQHDSASTFRFINVEEGTTLNLSKRANGTEWGPVTAERFTLGADAKVTLDAKFNHIVADTFAIDPTAVIEVTIGDTLTCGAFAILQSPSGTTPAAALIDQIEIKGNTSGWALKAADGQITLYKAGTVSGDYATEWIGRGDDNKVNTLANFVSALPSQDAPVYFGADETRTTAEWRGPIANNGWTLGGLHFLETAINTFGYVSHGETGWKEPFMCSYSGVPQKHLSGTFRTPYLLMRTRGHGPLVFEGEGDATWGGSYYSDNYWQWRNEGDCRIAKPAFNLRNLAFYALTSGGFANYSRLTVLSGSVVDVQELYSDLAARATGFRVEEGGVLKFTDTLASTRGWRRYAWTSSPAGMIVNGTMDIQTPFVGGVEQAYGGRGTLKLATTIPSNAVSRVWLMDTLTTELSNDWQTVTSASDTPLAIGAAAGTPVLRVPNGWEYGVGAATSSSAADRAIAIREGAVLTIDAGGGSATLAEAVTGDGTLAVAGGTTLTMSAAADNTAGLLVRGGAKLEVPASLSLGALTAESGAVLDFAQNSIIAVNGDVSLAGGVFAFAGVIPNGWRTVLVCTNGTVSGAPSDNGFQKTRLVVDENGRQVVQCKAVIGMILKIR